MKRSKNIFLVLPILLILVSCKNYKVPDYGYEELVGEYYSPTNSKKVCVYQGPTKEAIMVDDFVVCEIEDEKDSYYKNKIIYYKNHEQFFECYWKDDDNIVINGQIINIADKKTWIHEE